jgi:peptidoglycan/xylan/chitin deacetylase (PgdA/CDA1 family)
MIGQNVKARPKLAKEVADRGHEIGNHTYTHPMLSKMSDEAVHDQLYRTQQVILEATGKTPVWFRPPYGAFRKSQGHIAVALGLGIIYWSVDPQDWSRPGVQNIISRVVDHTTPGSIILMHDLHDQTAEAINTVLDGLKQKAFAFTNVTRFLGLPYV